MTADHRFLQIDSDGYLISEGIRLIDKEFGLEVFENLHLDDNHRVMSRTAGHEVFVEAFDEVFVAIQVNRRQQEWTIQMPYDYIQDFTIESLCIDEWNRIHGKTSQGLSFVFSRQAQAEFFHLVDDSDHNSITIDSKKYRLQNWLMANPDLDGDKFWRGIYQSQKPRWELDQACPPLRNFLPKLKLSKQRVLVLGAGSGNDAALFASNGHLVTMVDISQEAIDQARAKFSSFQNLSIVHDDAFSLAKTMTNSFDLIFEHTFFCAINPARRNELIRLWKKTLVEDGHLLGIFFVHHKNSGPPYGGSEWELSMRLKNNFKPLYWQRCHDSLPRRLGKELLIYTRKQSFN